MVTYLVLVSVISSDLGQLLQPGENARGISCGSSPHAAMSTLMFFAYSGVNFYDTGVVAVALQCTPVHACSNVAANLSVSFLKSAPLRTTSVCGATCHKLAACSRASRLCLCSLCCGLSERCQCDAVFSLKRGNRLPSPMSRTCAM